MKRQQLVNCFFLVLKLVIQEILLLTLAMGSDQMYL